MSKILITGTSRGLGKALVIELTERGHDVIATARNIKEIEKLPSKWKYELDVTNDESIGHLWRSVGIIDALINNAGYSVGGPVESIPLEEVSKVYDTNVFGPLKLIRAFTPAMRAQRNGTIINISSAAARFAPPYGGIYSSSKAALEMMSEALWFELRHFGIQVILAEPGAIRTEMAHRQKSYSSKDYDLLAEQMKKRFETFTMDDRRTTAEEVSRQIADLINNAGGHLRFPIGNDSKYLVGLRTSLDDRKWELEAPFNKGLNW